MSEAEEYRVQLSNSEDFSSPRRCWTTVPFIDIDQLSGETTYYWRVKSINVCGESAYSAIFQFSTDLLTCSTYAANNVPRFIQDATQTASRNTIATILVADDLFITDINVRVNITHTYVDDLTLTLIAPGEKLYSLEIKEAMTMTLQLLFLTVKLLPRYNQGGPI